MDKSESPPPPTPKEAAVVEENTQSWSSWLNDVKEQTVSKTMSTLEFVQQDLNEFAGVMTEGASGLASSTADTLKKQAAALNAMVMIDAEDLHEDETKEKKEQPVVDGQPTSNDPVVVDPPTTEESTEDSASWWTSIKTQATAILAEIDETVTPLEAEGKAWMGSVVNTMSKAMSMEDTVDDEDIPVEVPEGEGVSKLFVIECDEGTYANEPSGAPELYDDWSDHFEMDAGRCDEVLANNATVRQMFNKLVIGGELAEDTFWRHYFYRVHQHDLDSLCRSTLHNVDKEVEQISNSHQAAPTSQPATGTSSPLNDDWSVCSGGEKGSPPDDGDGEEEKHEQCVTPTKKAATKEGEWVDWSDGE